MMKVKLGDIFEIGSGGTPSKSHPEYYGGNIPWVKTGDLKNTYLYSVEDFITESGLNNSSAKMYEPDTVLIAMYGATIGATSILKINACTNQACAAFKPNDKVKPEYLYYFLRSKKNEFIKDGVGGAQPNISAGYLKKVDMELPEIKEQNEIVTILNKSSDVVSMRKKELKNLDDLIKARFVELFGDPEENPFGWDKTPLSEVIINANNGMARRGNDEDGNIVMRLVELQDGYIDYSNPNRIILKDNEKKRYILKDKDFLFARVNGNPDNVGRCAVFHDIGEDVYHNDHIIRVHFNEELLHGTFASALLNSDYGKRQLKSQIKTSAGQYTVSQDGIGAIVTILPSMDKQNQFAEFVAQVDKSKVKVQQSLDEAQILMDSLMQKYFG